VSPHGSPLQRHIPVPAADSVVGVAAGAGQRTDTSAEHELRRWRGRRPALRVWRLRWHRSAAESAWWRTNRDPRHYEAADLATSQSPYLTPNPPMSPITLSGASHQPFLGRQAQAAAFSLDPPHGTRIHLLVSGMLRFYLSWVSQLPTSRWCLRHVTLQWCWTISTGSIPTQPRGISSMSQPGRVVFKCRPRGKTLALQWRMDSFTSLAAGMEQVQSVGLRWPHWNTDACSQNKFTLSGGSLIKGSRGGQLTKYCTSSRSVAIGMISVNVLTKNNDCFYLFLLVLYQYAHFYCFTLSVCPVTCCTVSSVAGRFFRI